MVFASLTFLYIFLPLNLILYYLSKNSTYRNVLLTLFSFVFYAWGEPVWILLLVFSSMVDYANALFIEKYRETKWARLGIVSTVIFNAGILMAFKYSGFVVENINLLLGTNFAVPEFALPVGISFYTFQTVSYVIDVYRREVPAQRSPMKFLMFVSLYHQLVAGPIVRYSHIAHEIDNRKFNIGDISSGVGRFCIGLFKKVCIANVAGELVAKYLDGDFALLSVGEAWFGLIMFSVQIYFDFSGYSDMAIGLGRMFGFHYHENFNYPYIAKSATEFWRRWHISLGTFFRDYLYIPLGGNKRFPVRNLFVVWFLTGLWHGASWNFIFWGLYFGLLIYAERLFLFKLLNKIPAAVSHVYLLIAAVLGWALFYFESLPRLGAFFEILFGANRRGGVWDMQLTLDLQENVFWLLLTLLLCLPVYHWFNRRVRRQVTRQNRPYFLLGSMALSMVLLFMATAMLTGKSYNPFIYYRF
ncbi:MAG: MBOAT family protein [Bacteroidia bacterium]|nr:MBOAT family protein [Bacteroidia bacterium]